MSEREVRNCAFHFTSAFVIKLDDKHSLAGYVPKKKKKKNSYFNGWISNDDFESEFPVRSRFYESPLDTGEPAIYRF